MSLSDITAVFECVEQPVHAVSAPSDVNAKRRAESLPEDILAGIV